MKLSIVVPAYQEEELLAPTVRSLLAALAGTGAAHEVVVVDDGSRDRTPEVADELARAHPEVSVIHQANQGIGGAFRAGLERARGDYVALWPADMPCDPPALAPFVEALGTADVIVGVRRARVGYSPLMRLNARVYPVLVGTLFGLWLRDVNWICLYRAALLRRARLDQRGIPMLAEALVRLRDLGATFREVEVDMVARAKGVPSASRPRVMYATLRGLLAFWNQRRREA